MVDLSAVRDVSGEGERSAEGGRAALGAAGWLGLAAAPTFALMALWSALSSASTAMRCLPMADASPSGGMATMYLLMSAFHAAPWLKLLSPRWGRAA